MEKKPSSHLSRLSKFLTVWIFLAMALGVAIGYIYPKVSTATGSLSIGTTSIRKETKLNSVHS
jgi:ACR3 family arsenite transporter